MLLIMFQLFLKQIVQQSHGFKFEESWLLWDDYESLIKGAWEKASDEAMAMTVAKQKINVCGADLLA